MLTDLCNEIVTELCKDLINSPLNEHREDQSNLIRGQIIAYNFIAHIEDEIKKHEEAKRLMDEHLKKLKNDADRNPRQ